MHTLYLFRDQEPCVDVQWPVKPQKGEIMYYKSIRYRVEEVVHDVDTEGIKVFMYRTEQAKADGKKDNNAVDNLPSG